MRISILGSKGIVGNAIFKSLKNKFIYELNSIHMNIQKIYIN